MVLKYKKIVFMVYWFLFAFFLQSLFADDYEEPFISLGLFPSSQVCKEHAQCTDETVSFTLLMDNRMTSGGKYSEEINYDIYLDKNITAYDFIFVTGGVQNNTLQIFIDGKLVNIKTVESNVKNMPPIQYLEGINRNYFSYKNNKNAEKISIVIKFNSMFITGANNDILYYNPDYLYKYELDCISWNKQPHFSVNIRNCENENWQNDAWINDIVFRLKSHKDSDLDTVTKENSCMFLMTPEIYTSYMSFTRLNGNSRIVTTNEFSKNYYNSMSIHVTNQQSNKERNYNWMSLFSTSQSNFFCVNIKNRSDCDVYGYKYRNVTIRNIQPAELFFLTERQLRILRNAFYAAHGYQFKSNDLQEFFEYTGHAPANPNFTENEFSDIEKYNIKMIQQMEDFYNK